MGLERDEKVHIDSELCWCRPIVLEECAVCGSTGCDECNYAGFIERAEYSNRPTFLRHNTITQIIAEENL